jgi:Fe-S cluster biogenesis protein NfuA
MQGACSGCPSSSATLKQGIESLLALRPRSQRSARGLIAAALAMMAG